MYGLDGPAGAIWSRADSPGENLRLIELANARPTE